VIDLSRLPRRFEGTGAARLLAMRSTLAAEGGGHWCYDLGQSVGFSLEFEVFEPIEEPDVGYSIFSLTGVEIASTGTHQSERMKQLLPGRYQMDYLIPKSGLNPGTYVLSLWILNFDRQVDNILEAAQIEIMPDPGARKTWAPFSPETVFKLAKLS
jgi:hypothetical protein